MKKTYFFLLCAIGLTSNVFGGNFEDNLHQVVKESFNEDLQIVSSDSFKGIKGLRLALLKNRDGNVIPLYVSDDGKSFLYVSQYFHFANDYDKELFTRKISEAEKLNQQASEQKVGVVFDSLPDKSSILLSSKAKTDALLTIVTDPDCPYCRAELKNLREHLETTNVRLIIAPVHDDKAFVKGALILEEAKKFKPEDSDKIIPIFEKYYQDIKLDEKQMKTDISVIRNNADKIFRSGFIRGVPYLHHGKMK